MTTLRDVPLRSGLRVLFWAALLAALARALWPDPFTEPYVGHWDKVTHGAGCFVLTLLAGLAYPHRTLRLLGLGILAFGVLVEALQAIPVIGRDASWLDLAADAAGIGVALLSTLLPGMRETLRRRAGG